MTTLTQSDLDDMRRKAEASVGRRIYKFQGDPAATVLALLDHIAQLTAERDEVRKRADTIYANLEEARADKVALKSRIAALEEQLAERDEALTTAIKVAGEACREWDAAPSCMKAGKLLIALSDPTLRYRADITAMHAIRARSEQEGK